MNASAFELTIEQQFHLRTFEEMLKQASIKDLRDMCLEQHRQLIIKNNIVTDYMRKELGAGL